MVKFRALICKQGLMALFCVYHAGLIICPSRELAKQTFDIIQHYSEYLKRFGMAEIRSCMSIGGVPISESTEVIGK
jgi:ATP-dependent RNA helicase DDX41